MSSSNSRRIKADAVQGLSVPQDYITNGKAQRNVTGWVRYKNTTLTRSGLQLLYNGGSQTISGFNAQYTNTQSAMIEVAHTSTTAGLSVMFCSNGTGDYIAGESEI